MLSSHHFPGSLDPNVTLSSKMATEKVIIPDTEEPFPLSHLAKRRYIQQQAGKIH
jgi:hypothetical protein